MGREQGDEIPADPPVYVRTINGAEVERAALTPADEVKLKAQGWARKTEKRGGKRERAARATSSAAAGGTESNSG